MNQKSNNTISVGAYYYLWYGKPGIWKQPVTDIPILGLGYNNLNSSVIEKHVEWARKSGIDFFIVSWDGIRTWEDTALKKFYLAQHDILPIAIMYESGTALHMPETQLIDFESEIYPGVKRGQKFLEDMEYLTDTYFADNRYFKINNQPVIVLYLVRNWRNYSHYLDVLKSRMKEKGISLYVIADVVWWSDPREADVIDWTVLQKHFTGITGYNMYDYAEPDNMANFFTSVKAKYQIYKKLADSYGLQFIPGLMVGYNDRNLRGQFRPILDRNGSYFYNQYWTLAKEFRDRYEPIVLVTSFNEWFEGTEIEPSIQYGDKYLTLTKSLIKG